jgi:hypothetical protein
MKVSESSERSYSVVLELNDVIESDAGLYKVKAKNKFGEVAASINLNFSRELHFRVSEFKQSILLRFTHRWFNTGCWQSSSSLE